MMNVKLLPIFVIALTTVSAVSFGMETPKQVTILCKDSQEIELDNIERTKDKPGLGDILGTSQTIKNMLESLESEELFKTGKKLSINQSIPLIQIPAENFNRVYQYMLLLADKKKLNEDHGEIHRRANTDEKSMISSCNEDTITEMTFSERMIKCAKLREGISNKLQESSMEILCQQLPDFDYLDIRGQNKKQQDISFLDEHLIPAISDKFDYETDDHYKCIENIHLFDHKKNIAKNIAEKLSITTIYMSQVNENLMSENPNQVRRNSILGCSLDTVKMMNNLIHSPASITSTSEKGNTFVFGYNDGKVVIGRVECGPGMSSYPQAAVNGLLYSMNQACEFKSVKYTLLGLEVIAKLLGSHTSAVESVDLHPTKLLLVTADAQEVKLWNLATLCCMRTFNKDSDGIFYPGAIRFSKKGDRIISGPDEKDPVSSWKFHDPYEIIKYLLNKKKTLVEGKSFLDDILSHVPTISWSEWLLSYKKRLLFGGLALCGLLYYKRNALVSFLRSCF